jgi:hypothetical protein
LPRAASAVQMPEPQGKDPLPDPPQFIEVGLAGPQLTCSVAGVVGFELPENELFVGIDVFRGSVPDISSQDVRRVGLPTGAIFVWFAF